MPTYPADTPAGTVELPIRCQDGGALTAYFTADPAAVAGLLEGSGLGPAVRIGGRPLVAVHAAWNRRTSLGGYRELHLGVVVPDPWRRGARVWPDLLRGADRRRSGSLLAGSVVDAEIVAAVAPRLWGAEPYLAPLEFEVGAGSARVVAGDPGDRFLTLGGALGPGVPVGDRDLVGYARHTGGALRWSVRTRGTGRAHPAPRVRLTVGPSAHPLAHRLRELGLDGARPLLCLSATSRQTLRGAGVPVLLT